MKDEKEINVSVAESLGWKIGTKKFLRTNGWHVGKRWEHPNHPCEGGGEYGWGYNSEPGNNLPSYVTDANTRPEMLASLTWTEKFQLINLQSEGKNYNDVGDHLVGILELDQPTFAKLFCQVKGIL